MQKTLFTDPQPFLPTAFDIVVYYDAALQEGTSGLIKCPLLAIRKDSHSEMLESFSNDDEHDIFNVLERQRLIPL